jgi:hypothetical protein
MSTVKAHKQTVEISIGLGDYVSLTTAFPLMGLERGDTGVIVGVAPWGEWTLLIESDERGGSRVRMRRFPASVLKVEVSALGGRGEERAEREV